MKFLSLVAVSSLLVAAPFLASAQYDDGFEYGYTDNDFEILNGDGFVGVPINEAKWEAHMDMPTKSYEFLGME